MESASWAEDVTIFFSVVRGGLYRVPAGGGEPELVAEADRDAGELSLSSPQPLPGGKALLLTVGMPFKSGGGFFDSAQVAVLNLETGKRTRLLQGGGSAVFVPTGHLVYAVSGGLRAVAFDPVTLAVHGDPVPVLDGMVTKDYRLQADFALSSDGSLVYVSGIGSSDPGGGSSGESTLVWVDREGREEPLGAPPASNWYPSISPEGGRVAFTDLGESLDLWIWDLRRRARSRLTRGTVEDLYSIWTPDGRAVIFASGDLPDIDLYRTAADGTGGEAERLTEHPEPLYPSSLSPDGKALVYRSGANPPFDLGVLDLDSGKTRPLLAGDFDELNGAISPDGRFLAYQSNESGRPEIYVRPFPEVEGGRWPISTQGGAEPRWSPDGSELFYRAGDRMMAAPVRTQPTFEAGSPEELFTGAYVTRFGRMYDVSSDGKRFLMVKEASRAKAESDRPQVVLVQNWFEELKRLVPTR
jgi:serine/threonine-protein kinase